MILFEADSADAVWRQAAGRVWANGLVQESRNEPTRELIHVAFTLTDPRQRVVFARPINPALAVAEVIWILSGGNDVGFLSFWNPRMRRFTDCDDCVLHGAYGYRLQSRPSLSPAAAAQLRHTAADDTAREPKLDQVRAAHEALRAVPHSRQVVLQIWDSERDLPNPTPRSNDVPCNVMSHAMIRGGKLEWLQVMRSNDLIWGTPYNMIQFTTIQEIMAGWLGVDVGTYNQISDSLHVYRRHWPDLAQVGPLAGAAPTNRADLRLGPYEAWERVWACVVDGALALTRHCSARRLLGVLEQQANLPAAYREWMALLTAEALRRRGHVAEANGVIDDAGPYWATSWRIWTKSKVSAQRSEP